MPGWRPYLCHCAGGRPRTTQGGSVPGSDRHHPLFSVGPHAPRSVRRCTFRLLPSLQRSSHAPTTADDGGGAGLADGRGHCDRRRAPGDALWVKTALFCGRCWLCATALCRGLRVLCVFATHGVPQRVQLRWHSPTALRDDAHWAP